MKKIFTLLLVVPVFSFAQQKGDNAIVVDTVVSMNHLKTILFRNGLVPENQDTSFILTTPKSVLGIRVKLLIAKTDSNLVFKPLAEFSNGFEIVSWNNNWLRYDRDIWTEMNKIAMLFSNKISYITQ